MSKEILTVDQLQAKCDTLFENYQEGNDIDLRVSIAWGRVHDARQYGDISAEIKLAADLRELLKKQKERNDLWSEYLTCKAQLEAMREAGPVYEVES